MVLYTRAVLGGTVQRNCASKYICLHKQIINNTKAGGEQKLIDREIEILRSLTNTNNPYLVRLE